MDKTKKESQKLLRIITYIIISVHLDAMDYLWERLQFNYVLFLNTFLVEKNLKAGLVFGFQFPKFKFLDIKSQFHVQINSIYILVNFNTIWIKTLVLFTLFNLHILCVLVLIEKIPSEILYRNNVWPAEQNKSNFDIAGLIISIFERSVNIDQHFIISTLILESDLNNLQERRERHEKSNYEGKCVVI